MAWSAAAALAKDAAPGVAQGLLGMGGSAISAKMARDFAREQTRFNYQMAITAHQREVADLRLAGLNPILSAGGGGAPQPNAPNASIPDLGSAAGGIVSSALAAARLRKELQLMGAQTRRTDAEAKIAGARVEREEAQAQLWREANEALKVFVPWAKEAIGDISEARDFFSSSAQKAQRNVLSAIESWKDGYEAGVNRFRNRTGKFFSSGPRERRRDDLDTRRRGPNER